MSTQSNMLIDQIAAPENLLYAWRAVRSNIPTYRRNRSTGPDGITLEEYQRDLQPHLSSLRHALRSGQYQPTPPGRFRLSKHSGGYREISLFCITDRIAMRAAQQVIEPLFESDFLECSFGFRPGRSVQDAALLASQLRLSGNDWVVDGDISACFDSLNHELLLSWLQKRIKEPNVIDLFKKWLDCGVVSSQSLSSDKSPGWSDQLEMNVRKGLTWVGDWMKDEVNSNNQNNYSWQPDFYDNYSANRSSYFQDPEMDEAPFLEQIPYSKAQPFGVERDRKDAAHKAAMYGLRAAAGWVAPAAGSVGLTMAKTITSSVTRRWLVNGVLVTGGVAGAALGLTALGLYLKKRYVPSTTIVGVSQGSPLSPLLANIYLHPFDLYMTRAGHHLVRYADDWVILCPTEDAAMLAYNEAIKALARINLKINPDKTHIIHPRQPLEWLGMKI